jgi:CheY-like chemotaxis protein
MNRPVDVIPPTEFLERPTILCVDDDPEIGRSIELILSNYEVTVVRETCGRLGAWDVYYQRPDLIVTDLRMPNGNGEQLLQLIKSNSNTAHIPVIVVTGQRHPHLRGHVKLLGACGFLQKPFHRETLIKEITLVLPLRELNWETQPACTAQDN